MNKRKRRKYAFADVDGKTVRKHRLIMEQHLGRKLKSTEDVHHIDEDGQNNDLSNLEIISHKRHAQISSRKHRTAAKLKPVDIPVIRNMLRDKIKIWLICKIYGVTYTTIYNIKILKRWSWV